MADGGVDTSCFLKSQILALCFVLTEEWSQLVFDLHEQKQETPPPPVWERWGLLHLGQDFPPFFLAIRIFQEGWKQKLN